MNKSTNNQEQFLTAFLKRGKRLSISQMHTDRLMRAELRRGHVRPRIWIHLDREAHNVSPN